MRLVVLLLVGVAALPAAGARAATPPVGSLTQLPGEKGCFVDPSSVVAVNGCRQAYALQSPQTVVLSPDERFAYTPSNFSNAIGVFGRSPGGKLSQLGCVSSATPGCALAVNARSVRARPGDGLDHAARRPRRLSRRRRGLHADGEPAPAARTGD
jgi:hypothetical protein